MCSCVSCAFAAGRVCPECVLSVPGWESFVGVRCPAVQLSVPGCAGGVTLECPSRPACVCVSGRGSGTFHLPRVGRRGHSRPSPSVSSPSGAGPLISGRSGGTRRGAGPPAPSCRRPRAGLCLLSRRGLPPAPPDARRPAGGGTEGGGGGGGRPLPGRPPRRPPPRGRSPRTAREVWAWSGGSFPDPGLGRSLGCFRAASARHFLLQRWHRPAAGRLPPASGEEGPGGAAKPGHARACVRAHTATRAHAGPHAGSHGHTHHTQSLFPGYARTRSRAHRRGRPPAGAPWPGWEGPGSP